MTSTDRTARAAPARPSTPLRRALGFELRHHRDHLVLLGVIAVVLIQLAWHLEITLGVVAILLATRLPADLADSTPIEGRMLRSTLGISRADAVRARFLVVTAGQLLLAVAAAWIILLVDHGPDQTHWSILEVSCAGPGPSPLTFTDHLVDIALWCGALAWTHALIGGEAFRLGRRPTGRRALALFLGICLLVYLVIVLGTLGTGYLLALAGAEGVECSRFAAAATSARAAVVALTLGGGLAALLVSRRRWIRRA